MKGLLYPIGIICIFASIFYLIQFIASIMGRKRWKLLTRLQTVKELDDDLSELEPMNKPFNERVIRPAFRKLGRLVESMAPAQIRKSLGDRLSAAGYTGRSSLGNFMTVQVVLIVLLPLLFITVSVLSGLNTARIILFGLIGLLLAVLIPLLVLSSKKNDRQNKIRKSLPDMLDLLVISVEAGLGFDMALVKVTEKMKGPLSDELSGALSDIRMGKIRRLALKEMAERTGVEELISFISAVFQADQLGVSIGNVLRVQSDAMRTYRRQKLEERASKAPVKMLIPLVFCILPSLFVVILGPAFIKIIDIFKGTR